jgi:hypothetical protein
MSDRLQPVGRLRSVLVALAAVVVVTGLGAGLDLLRHTDELGTAAGDIRADDPRQAEGCPGEAPREGEDRDAGATAPTAPAALSSADLYDCPQLHDGRAIVFRGEVVGQVLGRGERVWLQVNDDAYAELVGPLPRHRYYLGGNSGVGVSVTRDEAAGIRWRGGPSSRGDRVEVEGVFHRVEPRSGEVAVIVATRLDVIEVGEPIPQQRRRDRQVVAYLLGALALGLSLLQHRRARS